MSQTAPRPIQVTLAGWLVVGGSVAVVLAAFDQIAGLDSLETRRAVEEFLDQGGLGLGLDVQQTLSVMRVLTMVAAACATAAAILGVQVLQRKASARVGLSFLAPPLFVAGVVLGGTVPAIVVGSIVMMWIQPSRDWISGRAAPVPPARPALPALPAPEHLGSVRADLAPGPTAPRTAQPPATLVWACALTWFGCVGFTLLLVASAVVAYASPGVVEDVIARTPDLDDEALSVELVQRAVAVMAILVAAWSVAASVFAAVALRGRAWGRVALLISSGATAALCFTLVLGSVVMLVPMTLCVVVISLLTRPEVRAFSSSRP